MSPLGSEQYKIITWQEKLNELLALKITRHSRTLKRLKFVIADKIFHIRGIIHEPKLKWKSLKPGDIFFDITLTKEEVFQDEIVMRIRKFRVHNPKKKLDLWKFVNLYSPVIRNRILSGLTGENTPFFLRPEKNRLGFDLKYILKRLPSEMSLLGQISIRNVALERRKFVWYIESNVVLKSLIDYLGPSYLEVEKIDFNMDVLKLLTDLNLDHE